MPKLPEISASHLLAASELTVRLPTPQGWVCPVNQVSLRIDSGECLGLVGESGSGKTMLSLALMGLLPAGARVNGEVFLHASRDSGAESKRNLVTQSEKEWQRTRGREVAMIFQEPMTSLNPVMRVGEQIAEAIRVHAPDLSRDAVRNQTLAAMRQASLSDPALRAEQYPHQLSGGLRQRAMIAMALAAGPKLLIADEPTTALDVTVQKEILELLKTLRGSLGLGLLFITHDLGVVAQVADRVAVMYAGRIVEEGPAHDVLVSPQHPYTRGLLAASPKLERGKLVPIPGNVPQLAALPPGCSFEPRCSLRIAECGKAVPNLRTSSADHAARCVLV